MSKAPITKALLPLALGAVFSLSGCDNERKPAANSPSDKPAPSEATAVAKKSDEKPVDPPHAKAHGGDKVKVVEGKRVSGDERYDLMIKSPDALSGKEAKVIVRVVPKGPWHMNLDFPTSLKVSAPASVSLAKAEQKKADAVSLTDDDCQYDVAFTASEKGDQSFTGKFKFAVCQDEACAPVTEQLEFKVAVK